MGSIKDRFNAYRKVRVRKRSFEEHHSPKLSSYESSRTLLLWTLKGKGRIARFVSKELFHGHCLQSFMLGLDEVVPSTITSLAHIGRRIKGY